jgi:hypothetical protein
MFTIFRLFRRHRNNPGAILILLARAGRLDEHEASVAAAFRAGLRLGLQHPELAEQVVGPQPLTGTDNTP